MLVLSRKIGDKLVIEHAGETLVIELVPNKDCRSTNVRMTFDGPRSFLVLRSELLTEREAAS